MSNYRAYGAPVGLLLDRKKWKPVVDELTGMTRPAGFELCGWYDFPNGEYRVATHRDHVWAEIDRHAKTKGDAGVQRRYKAAPGEVYRVLVEARIGWKKGGFKLRVTMAALLPDTGEPKRQLKEYNEELYDVTDDYQTVVLTTDPLPRGTAQVLIKARGHTHRSSEGGSIFVRRMRMERLK